MTNDRELLELAAKAAGIDAEWFRGCSSLLRRGSTVAEGGLWNPLEDDGDALRLAVQLNLEIARGTATDARLPWVSCYQEYEDVHEEERWQKEFLDSDPYAATRRAIVRAAAEIGKEMK